MSRHGESKHAKRSVITRAAVIPRKRYTYYTRALPGRHSVSQSISLLGFVRDLMRIANNAKEARYLIKSGAIKIDGKQIREEKYAIGFGDLLEVKDDKFIVNLDGKGKLVPVKNEADANIKKLKIVSKGKARGGRDILRLNDGRNLIVPDGLAQIGDTLLFNLSTKKVDKVLPLEQGGQVIVFRGKNAGLTGKIIKIDNDMVELEADGRSLIASLSSCFVV